MSHRSEVQSSGDHRRRLPSPADGRPLFHFFKVILSSTLEEKRLRIPYKFVQEFGNELSDVANLIIPDGRAWKVGLSKAEGAIWFDDGWQNFLEHHSICNGYFLVFGYRGFCNFSVFIFDMTACEIEYLRNGQGPSYSEKSLVGNEFEKQDDSSAGILTSTFLSPSSSSLKSKFSDVSANKREFPSKRYTSPEQNLGMQMRSRGIDSMVSPNFKNFHTSNKKLKVNELAEIINVDDDESSRGNLHKHRTSESDERLANEMQERGKSKCSSDEAEFLYESEHKEIQVITNEVFEFNQEPPESERAILAARMYMPKNPSFMVLLRATYGNRLYVPSKFARMHLNGAPTYIKLRVSDGREWEVRLHRKSYTRAEFGPGWGIFCIDNNLDAGDVCVFELVKDKEVLEVSMFRAIRDVRPES